MLSNAMGNQCLCQLMLVLILKNSNGMLLQAVTFGWPQFKKFENPRYLQYPIDGVKYRKGLKYG